MTRQQLYKNIYAEIKQAICVSNHEDVKRFRAAFEDDFDWQDTGINLLPATVHLDRVQSPADSIYQRVIEIFAVHCHELFWEQTYTKQDRVVSDDMLADYGFAEILGKRGPLVSNSIRCGIGVWGPGIDYPVHSHDAEEIYIILSGSARFTLDGNTGKTRTMGVLFTCRQV